MKHRCRWLTFIPLTLCLASFAQAGHFRFGGCSDPFRHRFAGGPAGVCQPVYGPAYTQAYAPAYGPAYAPAPQIQYNVGVAQNPVYCGESFVSPAPVSTGYVTTLGTYAPAIAQSTPIQESRQLLSEPMTGYRVVMEAQFVTETVAQPGYETRTEKRYRTKTVYKSVPVTEEKYRTKSIMVPKSETKTVEYTVLVPEQSTKTVDVTVSVPVWNEINETYTVKVPQIIDVPETYTVKVPVLRDEEYVYTVYVPQTETVTKMQTVTNSIPVTKTKTVSRVVPVYKTQTVTKDFGHYETVVEEVAVPATYQNVSPAPVSNGCAPQVESVSYGYAAPAQVACGSVQNYGHRRGCLGHRHGQCGCGTVSNCGSATVSSYSCGSSLGVAPSGAYCGNVGSQEVVYANAANPVACETAYASAPSVRTVSRQVWVPNVVTEEVPVVESTTQSEEIAYTVYEQKSEQIPYESTYIVNRPEQRKATRKIVDYRDEARERTRKAVKYVDETRTRTRKELVYKTETKQESYPVVNYKTEKKTKEISFTVNIPEQIVEPYQSVRYDQVAEDVVEEYTVAFQVPTMKEAKVQVCRMVPKLVPYTYTPGAESIAPAVSEQVIGTPISVPSAVNCDFSNMAPYPAPPIGLGACPVPVISGYGCRN